MIFRLSKASIILILILFLSFWINIYGIGWGLPSFGGWAADEVIPLRVLEGVEQGFANGWHYKYPPFHLYLLAILYSPLLLLQKLNIIDLYSLSNYTILFYLGRFLTVILGVILLFTIYLCGLEIGSKRSSLFSVLITALSCTFIYYTKTINLEIPYLLWFMLSMLFYLRILKQQKLKDYILFSIIAAITVCTKDQAYGFYILTPIFIVIQHYYYLKKQNSNITIIQSLKSKKIIYPLIIGISVFLLIHNVVFNLEGFFEHFNLITSGGAKIRPRYEQTIWGQLQMLRQSLAHLRFCLGWGLYIICLFGLISSLAKFKRNYLSLSLLIPIISYYLFYICLIWYNNVRYLMPLGIIIAFFGGGLIDKWLKKNKYLLPKIIIISLIFIYTFAYSFSVNNLMVKDSRYYVEQWINKNISETALILSIGGQKYGPRLEGFKTEYMDHPSIKIVTDKDPDYIIINSGYDIRRFEANSKEYKFFDNLNNEIGYQLLLEYQSQPRWNFLDQEELSYRYLDKMYIYSNFDKINPKIQIFRKNN